MTTICVSPRPKLKKIQTGLIISQEIQYSPLQVFKAFTCAPVALNCNDCWPCFHSFLDVVYHWTDFLGGFFLNMVEKKNQLHSALRHISHMGGILFRYPSFRYKASHKSCNLCWLMGITDVFWVNIPRVSISNRRQIRGRIMWGFLRSFWLHAPVKTFRRHPVASLFTDVRTKYRPFTTHHYVSGDSGEIF